MTDDLKERLQNPSVPYDPEVDAQEYWESLCAEALAHITDLEARLATAEALALEYEHRHQRALSLLHEAEAGEDALAEALKPFYGGTIQLPTCHCSDCKAARALAAYEARRKGLC